MTGGRRGRLVVISGPSGAGKSSIARALARRPGVSLSVSATTRPMRDGETAGKDYHFVSEDDFVRRVVEGAFLEHASVHGHWYGTLRSEVDARIAAGDTVLLVIDVQGARRLRESGEPMTSIFILPPSREVLRQRLESRATETRESVERRLRAAEEELAERHHYEFLVVNDDLERAVREVEGILFTGNLPAGGGSTPDPDRVRKGK